MCLCNVCVTVVPRHPLICPLLKLFHLNINVLTLEHGKWVSQVLIPILLFISLYAFIYHCLPFGDRLKIKVVRFSCFILIFQLSLIY